MRTKLLYLLYRLKSGFWFLPTLLVVFALAAAFGSIKLDEHWHGTWAAMPWLIKISPEGARLLLSTVAGSMITIVSLVFSLTLVTLTIASSQLGPRLLMNFIEDTPTQVVLGSFVGMFLYSLLVLQAVDTMAEPLFVPQLSVNLTLIGTTLNFGFLIFFMHHVANGIQADSVIARMGSALTDLVAREFSESAPASPDLLPDAETLLRQAAPIESVAMGYIQIIDFGALVTLASEFNIVIILSKRGGHFVAEGELMAFVSPPGALDAQLREKILENIVLGSRRTMAQDLEFAAHALVEIALRALSPGINDPHTAISAIDYLSGALAVAAARHAPSPACADSCGTVRLLRSTTTFEGIVNSAFDEVRQASGGQPGVQIQLVKSATRIVDAICTRGQAAVLLKQVAAVRSLAAKIGLETCDEADLDEVVHEFERTYRKRLEALPA